jgi:hypothetical protein
MGMKCRRFKNIYIATIVHNKSNDWLKAIRPKEKERVKLLCSTRPRAQITNAGPRKRRVVLSMCKPYSRTIRVAEKDLKILPFFLIPLYIFQICGVFVNKVFQGFDDKHWAKMGELP